MKTKQFFSALLLAFATASFAQVGIGTTTPNASSMLEVDVTSLSAKKGLLPPRMTQAQRNAIASPAEGLTVYNTDSKCLEFFDGTCWQCHENLPANGSSATKPALSCKAIKAANPAATDGTYWLDIDGCGSMAAMQAYCDMTTDGGGWTLIGQFNHPATTARTGNQIRNDFPNRGSDNPSVDETTGTGAFGLWGLVGEGIRHTIQMTEYRVESYSNVHGFHFKSTDVSFVKNNTKEKAIGKTNLGKPSYWPSTTTYYNSCATVVSGTGFELVRTGPTIITTFSHSNVHCNGSGNYLISRIVDSAISSVFLNQGLSTSTSATNGLGRLWVR